MGQALKQRIDAPVTMKNLLNAVKANRPSVGPEGSKECEDFSEQFGTKSQCGFTFSVHAT